MTELTCQQCHELAAELALDVLSCHERARVLAHLEGCSTCQGTVSALTATTDRLVELLPAVEPPAGFEQRMIKALAVPRPRARRRWIPAAAGLLAIVLAAGGWIFGRASHDQTTAQTITQPENDGQAGERTVLYAPLTIGGHQTAERQVGHAYVYPGNPSWIYLSLDTNTTATSDTVKCEVIRRDGSTVPVGTFPLTHGRATWGGPAPVDRDTLATARLITGNGHTLARAHFNAPAKKASQPASRSHTGHQRHGHS